MRVLAVTDDTTMQVVLSLRSSPDLDVVTVSDLDALPSGEGTRFDAALVALRDIGRAMATIVAVRERLGELPTVLVATDPPPDLDATITAVNPTADLEQLERVVRTAVRRWPDPRGGARDDSADPAGGRRRRARGRGLRDQVLRRPSEPQSQPRPEREPDRSPEPSSQPVLAHEGVELPSQEDLRAGLRAVTRVQELLDQVPQLTSRPAVGHFIVDSVWDRFRADAVVLWSLNGADSLEAISWRGVSPSVLRHRPSTEQPLLAEILGGTDAVAYRSEQPYPAYLRGLPGLRGDSVIAAALRASGETHGIVVAAGSGYHDIHAADLRELVRGHAHLLAIAAHLELLRRRSRIDLIETDRETLFA